MIIHKLKKPFISKEVSNPLSKKIDGKTLSQVLTLPTCLSWLKSTREDLSFTKQEESCSTLNLLE